MPIRRRMSHAAAAAFLLTALVGCDPSRGTATISYEQLGACNGYLDGGVAVSAGPDAAYVLFKVLTLNNTNGKVPFAYDPARLYVTGTSPAAHVSPTLGLAQKIGVLGTTATTIAAGSSLTHNGYAVVVVPTSSSPDPQVEANATSYLLTYENDGTSPGVLFAKANASQTQYQGAQNCLGKAW